ncbi:anti-sigma-28 factor FlgM [Brenneria roseae subsp. roseae]|uniref:flagellar biosynthesis anti-sigma factor FlgM n=1 Tax=Brenneria roseae TaxID=1509241 RepID=UPI000D607D82|nr:flagellar biosynthesis anti-sigma factor FlgM [Brenneria roseae]PWC22134.1 anti-sigma-28 factor FlgM [Brenneria roseae subsp. roseae]
MSIDSTRPISGVKSVQSQDTELPLHAKGKTSNTSAQSTVTTETQVNISNAQTQLTQANEHDIDIEKVESLKQAIRNGELKIDAGKIADALIEEAQSGIDGL